MMVESKAQEIAPSFVVKTTVAEFLQIAQNLNEFWQSRKLAELEEELKLLLQHNVTLEILRETKVGKLVNDIRKAQLTESASFIAKRLIKKWKKLFITDEPPEKQKTSDNTASQPNSNIKREVQVSENENLHDAKTDKISSHYKEKDDDTMKEN